MTPAKGSTHGYTFHFNLGDSILTISLLLSQPTILRQTGYFPDTAVIYNRKPNTQYFHSRFARPIIWPPVNVGITAKQMFSLIELRHLPSTAFEDMAQCPCVCTWFYNWIANSSIELLESRVQWWCNVSMCTGGMQIVNQLTWEVM